ncbi:MAG: CNNM domain-containing protein [Bacillota bacterium]|nr:CNNM domain-containing protein [Bacillota bacterium]
MPDPACCTQIALADTDPDIGSITVFGLPLWAAILIIAILLLVSGLFSASENAFSNCDKYHFKVEAEKGGLTAKIVVKLTENFESTLVSVLVGNNIVQTLMSSISAIIFYNICNAYGLGDALESVLSTVVMAFLVYIISDTVPKILSKAMPNRMAVFLAWPDFIVSIILFPIIFIFKLILSGVHKLLKIKEDDLLSKEDLIQKADEAILETELTKKEEELLEPEEVTILKKALALSTKKVEAVYTPLEKVVTLEESTLAPKTVNEFLLSSPYNRIPVYRDEKTNIVGVLGTNVYFREYFKDRHLDPRSTLLPVLEIEYDEDLLSAFEKLTDKKLHMGIVTKDGVCVGIITLDDVLDELVVTESQLSTEGAK